MSYMHTLGKKHIPSELTVSESFKNDTLCVFYAAESELLFLFFFYFLSIDTPKTAG